MHENVIKINREFLLLCVVCFVHWWCQVVWGYRPLWPVAPEAVWQVGRPPHQSEIWYGGAIPIRDAGISLVLIGAYRKIVAPLYFFHSTSLPITFTNRHLNSAYLLT